MNSVRMFHQQREKIGQFNFVVVIYPALVTHVKVIVVVVCTRHVQMMSIVLFLRSMALFPMVNNVLVQ